MILIFGFFFEAEGGRLYQPAYTWVALICCALVVVTILACAWGTRDQIDLLRSKENPTQRLSLAVFARDVGAVLKNRNYRFLLVGLFFLSLTIGTHETLGIYMATFFWELTSYQYGFLVLNNIIGVHLGFFLSARLHGEFDKRLDYRGVLCGVKRVLVDGCQPCANGSGTRKHVLVSGVFHSLPRQFCRVLWCRTQHKCDVCTGGCG
jgi:Na+/melibiose symporter-like transporter